MSRSSDPCSFRHFQLASPQERRRYRSCQRPSLAQKNETVSTRLNSPVACRLDLPVQPRKTSLYVLSSWSSAHRSVKQELSLLPPVSERKACLLFCLSHAPSVWNTETLLVVPGTEGGAVSSCHNVHLNMRDTDMWNWFLSRRSRGTDARQR